MKLSAIEQWIEESLIVNQNLALNRISKGVKVFEISSSENASEAKEKWNNFLIKAIRLIDKKNRKAIQWFKINNTDNAITQLLGIGEMESSNDLSLIVDLLTKDTASQSGDTIIGLFDETRNWIMKITNHQEENRMVAKIYGEESIREKLKANFQGTE